MTNKVKWITVFEDGSVENTYLIDSIENFLIKEGHHAEIITLKRIDVLMHPSNENDIKDLVNAFLYGWEARCNLENKKDY